MGLQNTLQTIFLSVHSFIIHDSIFIEHEKINGRKQFDL